jgi:hypothetical protein
MLKEEFKEGVYVDKCYSPIGYMKSLGSGSLPLVLVSYKGSTSTDTKLYPGVCIYELFFVDVKLEAEKLFDVMQQVYKLFDNRLVITKINDKVITGQQLIYNGQSFYAESNEHVIYVQKYNLLIP